MDSLALARWSRRDHHIFSVAFEPHCEKIRCFFESVAHRYHVDAQPYHRNLLMKILHCDSCLNDLDPDYIPWSAAEIALYSEAFVALLKVVVQRQEQDLMTIGLCRFL